MRRFPSIISRMCGGCLTRACRFCSSRQKSIQRTECSGAVLPRVEFLVALGCQSNGFHLSCCYCSSFLPHRENHSPFSLPHLPLAGENLCGRWEHRAAGATPSAMAAAWKPVPSDGSSKGRGRIDSTSHTARLRIRRQLGPIGSASFGSASQTVRPSHRGPNLV
jgi:hypothetical protein